MHLAASGRHMAHNAAAALACVGAIGGDLQGAAAALAEVGLTAMRMEVQRTAAGAIVLNDSYNANPTSVRAALDALADLPATRRIAVLGLMAEISDPEAEHRAILEYAAEALRCWPSAPSSTASSPPMIRSLRWAHSPAETPCSSKQAAWSGSSG